MQPSKNVKKSTSKVKLLPKKQVEKPKLKSISHAKIAIYLGSITVDATKSLYYQLCQKVCGLGFINGLQFLKLVFPEKTIVTLKTIKAEALTEKQLGLLEQFLNMKVFEVQKVFSNRKSHKSSEGRIQELDIDTSKNLLIISDRLKATKMLDQKRLKISKTYIGERTITNRKRHGQKTKCTNRKKILKGFQK